MQLPYPYFTHQLSGIDNDDNGNDDSDDSDDSDTIL
jgi:hypothetical protein